MKGKLFKILVIICVVLAVVIMFALKQYNEPLRDIRNSKPLVILSADLLIDDFEKDEVGTTIKYSEKILQIEGNFSGVSTLDGNIIITLKNKGSNSSVICHMLPEENLKALKLEKGQNITIKGNCTGFLLDVMMVRCVLIESEK